MGGIAIVGVGRGPEGPLSGAVAERLRAADHVVVPSREGEAARAVSEAGVAFQAYEDVGLSKTSPADEVIHRLSELARDRDVVLATAGYPLLREGVVSGLLDRTGASVSVYPGVSPLEVLVLAFDIDLTADLDIVDAKSLKTSAPERGSHLIVTGVRNAIVARACAESLMDVYSPDHAVVVAACPERGGFDLEMTTVGELADIGGFGADSALYVAPSRLEPPGGFPELVRIVSLLRGPGGCPWDLEQTHDSLRMNMIEEAYEVVNAIEARDDGMLAEELGDLLLQIVFHAQIASEEDSFDIRDVLSAIVGKLRRRHPHVFGTVSVEDSDEVIRNWEAIKRDEKRGKGLLDDVPAGLPSLMRAQKVSRRAAAVGFDWESVEDVWAKVHEEIEELKQADAGDADVADEVGDVLFTVVNVARKLGVDAETALRGACDKFSLRFGRMESEASGRGVELKELALDELEEMWGRAKGTMGPDAAE